MSHGLKKTVINGGWLKQDGNRGLEKGDKRLKRILEKKRWRSKNTSQKTQKQIKIMYNISLQKEIL